MQAIWRHLSGKEISLQSGLPLGITADTEYPEVRVRIHPGLQITLYTDGVVEARAQSGELLGFDRAAVLSTQSAESIVQAAQSFGQDDDITVLTIHVASQNVDDGDVRHA